MYHHRSPHAVTTSQSSQLSIYQRTIQSKDVYPFDERTSGKDSFPLPRKHLLQAEHEARLVIIAPTRALCATCLAHVDASWGTRGKGSERIAHLAFSLDIARIDLRPSRPSPLTSPSIPRPTSLLSVRRFRPPQASGLSGAIGPLTDQPQHNSELPSPSHDALPRVHANPKMQPLCWFIQVAVPKFA